MNLEHLANLRRHELDAVLKILESYGIHGGRLLEVGAGTGQQARALSARGYEVAAIDLPISRYAPDRVWPVTDYDGMTIPFSAERFDVVYSSNVLEHVPDTDHMQREIRRVLAPGGLAVHVLPTAMWRVLTMLLHYPWLIKSASQRFAILGNGGSGNERSTRRDALSPPRRSKLELLRRTLYANRHGEHGNALTEAYHFRRARWYKVFERNGFDVVEIVPSGLFYSGYGLLGGGLPLNIRERLAKRIGSACDIYVLRPIRPLHEQ